MLAGSMGLLNTTAISRLVPTPSLWGTTIIIVGASATTEAGGLATLLQATRKANTRRAVEPLEKRRIDIRFLSRYLGDFGRKHTKQPESRFIRNFKEYFNPPKLPPLEITSKPVAVKDIWGLYGRQKKSFMMSTGFQVGLILVVLLLGTNKTVQNAVKQNILFMPITDTP